jgi:hypothetical protein
VPEQNERLLRIFLLGNAAQPDHVLHEQVESALSKVSKLFWGGRGATVSAMIVAVYKPTQHPLELR